MTLTDAIQHLKESLADPTHEWGCEECKQEHEQLLKWLEDYKELKTDYIELNTENNELKRLLKLAVDDLDNAIKSCEQDMLCQICSYHEKCDYINYCGGEYDRTWKNRDEAMELLGGTENAEYRTA